MCLALLIPACQEQEEIHLSREVMRDVLVEFHIADGYTERMSKPLNYRNALREDLYREVLAKHQLDENTFRDTYDYYTAHPYEMDTLYQMIIEKLEVQLTGEKNLKLEQSAQVGQKPAPEEEVPQKAPWQDFGDADN